MLKVNAIFDEELPRPVLEHFIIVTNNGQALNCIRKVPQGFRLEIVEGRGVMNKECSSFNFSFCLFFGSVGKSLGMSDA